MENIIEFLKELLTIIIMWKVAKFLIFGNVRSQYYPRLGKRILFLIAKTIVYIVCKLEQIVDAGMKSLDHKSNTFSSKHHK
jgi:hypothetical protein